MTKAVYKLMNLRLVGHVQEAGDGLYEFNTPEREKAGRRSFLVDKKDVVLDQ